MNDGIQYWLSLAAMLASAGLGHADSLAPKFSYTTMAPGGEYVFVMIAPKTVEEDGKYMPPDRAEEVKKIRSLYAASGLYRNDGSRTPLWTVDWYAYEVYPASDGVHLVRLGLSRLWSPLDCNNIAVEFYASGKLLRSYKILELVDVPRLLISNSLSPRWSAEDQFDDASLRYSLRTVQGEGFVFDPATGDMLEGSRLAAWARSGTVFVALCAFLLIALVRRWRRRRGKNRTGRRCLDGLLKTFTKLAKIGTGGSDASFQNAFEAKKMNQKLKELLERHAQWNPAVERLFQQPDRLEACPFCNQIAVKISWAVFSSEGEGRLASLDVWCEACRDHMHAVCVLPDNAPDSYPPGVAKYEAEMTKRIFGIGKNSQWW